MRMPLMRAKVVLKILRWMKSFAADGPVTAALITSMLLFFVFLRPDSAIINYTRPSDASSASAGNSGWTAALTLKSLWWVTWTGAVTALQHALFLHLLLDVAWTLRMCGHVEKAQGTWRALRHLAALTVLSRTGTLLLDTCVSRSYIYAYGPQFLEMVVEMALSEYAQLASSALTITSGIARELLYQHLLSYSFSPGFTGVLFAVTTFVELTDTEGPERRRQAMETAAASAGVAPPPRLSTVKRVAMTFAVLSGIAAMQSFILRPHAPFRNNLAGIITGVVYVYHRPILRHICRPIVAVARTVYRYLSYFWHYLYVIYAGHTNRRPRPLRPAQRVPPSSRPIPPRRNTTSHTTYPSSHTSSLHEPRPSYVYPPSPSLSPGGSFNGQRSNPPSPHGSFRGRRSNTSSPHGSSRGFRSDAPLDSLDPSRRSNTPSPHGSARGFRSNAPLGSLDPSPTLAHSGAAPPPQHYPQFDHFQSDHAEANPFDIDPPPRLNLRRGVFPSESASFGNRNEQVGIGEGFVSGNSEIDMHHDTPFNNLAYSNIEGETHFRYREELRGGSSYEQYPPQLDQDLLSNIDGHPVMEYPTLNDDDDDIQPLLQWKCDACSTLNGVFFTNCERCQHPMFNPQPTNIGGVHSQSETTDMPTPRRRSTHQHIL